MLYLRLLKFLPQKFLINIFQTLSIVRKFKMNNMIYNIYLTY